MTRHPAAERFFGSLAMVVAGAFALGAVYLLALGWANDPNNRLWGLVGAYLYVNILGAPGVAAFFLGRQMLRRSRPPSS